MVFSLVNTVCVFKIHLSLSRSLSLLMILFTYYFKKNININNTQLLLFIRIIRNNNYDNKKNEMLEKALIKPFY